MNLTTWTQTDNLLIINLLLLLSRTGRPIRSPLCANFDDLHTTFPCEYVKMIDFAHPITEELEVLSVTRMSWTTVQKRLER